MSKNVNKSAVVTVAYNSPRGINFVIGGKTIGIRGNASHLSSLEKGVLPLGQYGYTELSAEDWAAIEATYGSMEIFRSGLIFAESSRDRAESRAVEMKELRHGLEPVDVDTTASSAATFAG